MNIVLACNTMGRGGAEMQVKDYALRLVTRGHRVMVLSMLPFEDFEAELRRGGVETATLGMEKGKPSVRGFVRLAQVLRAFEPDVVHAHMFAAIFATRIARAALTPLAVAAGKRPPVVIGTAHTPFEFSKARYAAYRLSDPFGDLWTCVCQEGVDTHERYGAVPKGRGVLTANGIDVARFRPDADVRASKRAELGAGEDFLWLSVGSFRDEQKDYGNLLRSFARLPVEAPTRLLIAGDGKLFEEKKALAKTLGVAERVSFLGLRSDIAALMQAADAFVLGSAWEAMPIVLLEAAASGRPSVVTDVGQNGDLVVPGTGLVVPAKDDRALGEAMAKLLAMPREERLAMGEAARRHVSQTYDLEVIVEGWERRYRDLLGRRAA